MLILARKMTVSMNHRFIRMGFGSYAESETRKADLFLKACLSMGSNPSLGNFPLRPDSGERGS